MFNVLDLFSGIGGFSYGLDRTGGFRTVAFCEVDAYARRVLGRHWPDVPIFDDVRTLNAAVLEIFGVPLPDVLCGGFPCQDLSLAGRGVGLTGARSGLWFQYLRLIDEIRPAWVIIENVPALRSRGLDIVLRGIASLGYDAEWHCIPAAAVGAPHRRDRIWIIAYAAGTRPYASAQPGIYQGETSAGARHVEPKRLCGTRSSEPMAYADSVSQCQQGHQAEAECGQRNTRTVSSGSGDRQFVSEPLARLGHTDGPRLAFGQGVTGDARSEQPSLVRTDWWLTEPDVGRVAHGVPARVDRLKCLGNAIVPAIAELIGRAILDYETKPEDMGGGNRSPRPLTAPVVSQ